MRILKVVAILAFASLLVAPSTAVAAYDESTAHQVTPGHTGFASGGSLEPPLRTRWSHHARDVDVLPLIGAAGARGGRRSAASRAPVAASRTARASSRRSTAAAAPPSMLLWQFSGDRKLRSAPVIVNETVCAGSTTGRLLAVDLRTGAERWSTTVASGTTAGGAGMAAGGRAARRAVRRDAHGPGVRARAAPRLGPEDLDGPRRPGPQALGGVHVRIDGAGADALAARGWSSDTNTPTATITGGWPTG